MQIILSLQIDQSEARIMCKSSKLLANSNSKVHSARAFSPWQPVRVPTSNTKLILSIIYQTNRNMIT